MSKADRALPVLALTLMLGASILAATPAAGFPVSKVQTGTVANLYEDMAPRDAEWQVRATTNRFWPMSDPTASAPPVPVPGAPGTFFADGGAVTGAALNPVPPADSDTAPATVAGTPAETGGLFRVARIDQASATAVRFPMPESLAAADAYNVFRVDGKVLAGCDVGSIYNTIPVTSFASVGILQSLIKQKKDASNNWVDGDTIAETLLLPDDKVWTVDRLIGTTGTAPYSVQMYRGSSTIGDAARLTGPTVAPGERLVLEYSIDLNAQCFLYYGVLHEPSYCVPIIGDCTGNEYTEITLATNAARLATFITDVDGDRITGLPAPDSIDAEGRRFRVEALHASAFGSGIMPQLMDQRHANVRLADVLDDAYLYYVDDESNQNRVGNPFPGCNFPRSFQIQTIKLVSPKADDPCPEPDVKSDLGNSVLRRSYLFSYGQELATVKNLRAEFYSYTDGWQANAPIISIGGKGIAFEVGPAEVLTHAVNPGQKTQFTFLVFNTGSQTDVVTVSPLAPGDGWTATVLGGGQYFLTPGAFALGAVEVVPSGSAGIGASKTVTLVASSSYPDVDDPGTIAFTTEIVGEYVPDVELFANTDSFAVKPGQTKGFAVTLANLGTAVDNFVVLPSVPANVQGFTIVVSPTSVQVPAGGRVQLTVSVKAPAEASALSSFPLGLTAVAVGDDTIADRVDVVVSLVQSVGVKLSDDRLGVVRHLREDGTSECEPRGLLGEIVPLCGLASEDVVDTDFDLTALFRVPIENTGTKEESFRVEAFWDPSVTGTANGSNCDGGGNGSDGVPDGWRLHWDDGSTDGLPAVGAVPGGSSQHAVGSHNSGSGFSGRYQLQGLSDPLVVGPGQTVAKFLEIGHVPEFACGSNDPIKVSSTNSPVAALRLVVTSIRDPALTTSFLAQAKMDAIGTRQSENRFSGALRDNNITLAPGQAASKLVGIGAEAAPQSFDLRVLNTGNEKDGLSVRVTGSSGWTHALQLLGSTPSGISCETRTDGSLDCPVTGVYDELAVRVFAKPAGNARPGDLDQITVSVTSGDVSSISDKIALVVRASGVYEFASGFLGSATRDVPVGENVALPFYVRNLGTEGDNFRIGLTQADREWNAVLSTGATNFLPAGGDLAGFVTVQVPDDAPLNVAEHFRLSIESVSGRQQQIVDLFARPFAPTRLDLVPIDGTDVLLAKRGEAQDIRVRATLTSGAPTQVRLTADRLSLPPGWTVTPEQITLPMTGTHEGLPSEIATFKVTAPADALSTTRGLLHVTGTGVTETALKAASDVTLNLASTFGVELVGDALNQTIAPGGKALFNLTVRNLGLGNDLVRFTATALPDGWTLFVNPPAATLGPLENQTVTVEFSAPVTAAPRTVASAVLFAASRTDPGTLDSVTLRAQVGFHETVAKLVGAAPAAGPQETLVYVFNVTNNGTLRDQLSLRGVLLGTGLDEHVTTTATPALLDIAPGETKQVRFDQRLGDSVPPAVNVSWTANFASLLDETVPPAVLRQPTTGHVLDYRASDANRDGTKEFAVDRNRNPADGFEEFKPSSSPQGRPVTRAAVERFLREDAVQAFSVDVTLENGTVQRVLALKIDGDEDGKADHFLDVDGDDQPNLYWDPDAGKVSPIEFRKDVNGDQVPETFVDASGDGGVDAVYDLTRGVFTKVIQLDVDGDGQLDYVVDKDRDGQVDQDETVLYTRTGSLLIVQKVDVDGDGKLDQVFDTDGDGAPDYFIPAGTTQSVPIVLRDVNGDGVQDWTFDGDNDGRRESYYDPVTQKAHVVNAAGHFRDAFREYWYIGALFAVVVVLFVALILVTRR